MINDHEAPSKPLKAQIPLILQFIQKFAKMISLENTEHNGVCFSSIPPSYYKLHCLKSAKGANVTNLSVHPKVYKKDINGKVLSHGK